MPETLDDPWRDIVREAIETIDPPVVGTHFRAAVDRVAAKRDLRFPPLQLPELRFIQLLERYPDVVSILRRPKQDLLIAPAGKENLLAEQIQGRTYAIRNDFFQAFTMISDNLPYYDKSTDRVVWLEESNSQTLPDSVIPISLTTLPAELQMRHQFIETVEEPHRAQLVKSLDGAEPLQVFGRTVKEQRLQIQWHSFRTERVLERMQRWASAAKLEWKDAWLTQGRTRDSRQPYSSRLERPVHPDSSQIEADAFQLFLAHLDSVDIQRISIPLDLVLKVLSSLGK